MITKNLIATNFAVLSFALLEIVPAKGIETLGSEPNSFLLDRNIPQSVVIADKQISVRNLIRNFLTNLFKKQGMEEKELEFVDDESEKILGRYGFFFLLFIILFGWVAIKSLFFKKPK